MENALIIFLKYPEPGKVKTRLAKNIGNEKACEIYKLLAEKIIKNVFSKNPLMHDVHIFFTPADKDNELRPKSDTHYVAYEIFPKTFPPGLTTQTIDQWGLHGLQVRNSEYLLVPSRKDTFVVCTYKPNDCNGDGVVNLADIICDVNVVFKGFPIPVPKCRCDSDCNGVCNLVDIVYKKNYVFGGGPQPVPCKECCKPLP